MKKIIPVLIALCAIYGCSKPGPVGPAGASGANNVSSFYYTVSTWQNSGTTYYANITVPAITQTVLDSGAVLLYLNGTDNGTGQQFEQAMPYVDIAGQNNQYIAQLSYVQVQISNARGIPSALKYKVVVVQGQ